MYRIENQLQGSLPSLPKLPAKEMAGPTPWSNWVIPGRVIAGAYPASLDDAETERILTTLLELGINTFVCLQAEVNINTPEHAWRSQHGLRPYIKDAQKILSKAHETGNPKITQQKIDFLHLPIIDGNVTTDSALNRLAEDCMERILKGEKLYIHCWGGHGRTGTLVAVILGRLYNLPYTTALRYTQAFHDSRIYPQGVRSPQTPVQRAQVRRLLAAQSAVSSSAPGPMLAKPAQPVVQSVAGRPAANAFGIGAKPSPSILSPGGVARPGAVSADVGSRSAGVPQSPLRSRPSGVGGVSNRYAGGRSVGESPMKSAGVDVRASQSDLIKANGAAAVDRLAGDFGKLGTPSAGAASVMARNGVGVPYMLAQRAPARGPTANGVLRRSVAQEVNVR
mmetsp:Transcript_39935/g.88741  ORF Transcript_39935/g.88741 Transcript_39935/m.88741 type:complete len:394 (+) Transcript_39935:213-1394(+)